jgi:hypothetical protein
MSPKAPAAYEPVEKRNLKLTQPTPFSITFPLGFRAQGMSVPNIYVESTLPLNCSSLLDELRAMGLHDSNSSIFYCSGGPSNAVPTYTTTPPASVPTATMPTSPSSSPTSSSSPGKNAAGSISGRISCGMVGYIVGLAAMILTL